MVIFYDPSALEYSWVLLCVAFKYRLATASCLYKLAHHPVFFLAGCSDTKKSVDFSFENRCRSGFVFFTIVFAFFSHGILV
jgi:hypothetical protein